MKKGVIIVLIILAVIIVGVCILVGSLNKEKVSITADDFKTTMQAKGYTVSDVTSQFSQYGNYISKAYVAQDGTKYQIEFYELSNLDNATNFYNTNKAKFESQKGNASSSYTASMKNYSTYSITTNGKYKFVSRVDNSVVYIDANTIYQDSIKSVVKELGY